jgi:hypothetical protein
MGCNHTGHLSPLLLLPLNTLLLVVLLLLLLLLLQDRPDCACWRVSAQVCLLHQRQRPARQEQRRPGGHPAGAGQL